MFRLVIASIVFVSIISNRASAADPPKVWAIVIGIDTYDDPRITGCQKAETDAREVRSWLVETAGWDGINVLDMNPSARVAPGPANAILPDLRPTRKNLDWAVKEWLPARVRTGDVILIYFAGQAVGGRTTRDPRTASCRSMQKPTRSTRPVGAWRTRSTRSHRRART